jgi:hypothetical protein
METLFEDELVTLYPPTKTSTTSISVNLKWKKVNRNCPS